MSLAKTHVPLQYGRCTHRDGRAHGPAYRLLVEYRTHAPASEWNNIDSMLDSIRYVRNPWMKSKSQKKTRSHSPRPKP